jgi:hypothetical protein
MDHAADRIEKSPSELNVSEGNGMGEFRETPKANRVLTNAVTTIESPSRDESEGITVVPCSSMENCDDAGDGGQSCGCGDDSGDDLGFGDDIAD